MRQPFLIAFLLVVLSVFGKTLGAATTASEILDQARSLVANREYQKAAAMLEEVLPGSTAADRGELIGLLRQAYQNLISQAEVSGKDREAEEYRDNLAILEQDPAKPTANSGRRRARLMPPTHHFRCRPRPRLPRDRKRRILSVFPDCRRAPINSLSRNRARCRNPLPCRPSRAPVRQGPLRIRSSRHPTKSRLAAIRLRGPGTEFGSAGDATTARRAGEEPHPRPDQDGEMTAGSTKPLSSNSELAQADRWFTDKKYTPAGVAYARLAAQNQLPARRKQIWAYCRWVAVVALINAHPHTDREWDDIEEEIRSIQKLTPGNWYGEYLLNRVAEARRGGRGSARAGKLVVRGSAPDEKPSPRFPRLLAGAKPAPSSPQAATSGGAGEQLLGLPTAAAPQDRQPEPEPAAPSGAVLDPDGDNESQACSPAGAGPGATIRPGKRFQNGGKHSPRPCPCHGTFARPRTFGFIIPIPPRPRRRPRLPRQFAPNKSGDGEARLRACPGRPCVISTSIRLPKTSPS